MSTRAIDYKRTLEADKEAASKATTKQVVVTLTQQQYSILEQKFHMRSDTTDPINAAVQLGQQMVLQALRNGLVVAA